METIIEVATAKGMVLDWLVHKAARPDSDVQPWQFCAWGDYRPSVNPLTAHDIIVKYRVGTIPNDLIARVLRRKRAEIDAADDEQSSQWMAVMSSPSKPGRDVAYGPTMLIAAMRCVVVARLGVHVPVPETIINHRGHG